MITHWFIADPHLGHNNIIKYCNRHKYMTEQEKKQYKEDYENLKISDNTCNLMTNDILGEINNRAKTNDHVWVMGDFGFGKNVSTYLERIVCKNIHLIIGNHDDPDIFKYFSSCHYLVDLCIFQDGNYCINNDTRWHWKKNGNITITLCHYAMVTWNREHLGTYHLYGHSHTNIEPKMNVSFPDRKSADVGVDNIYKHLGYYGPISHLDIPNFISKNKEMTPDEIISTWPEWKRDFTTTYINQIPNYEDD